jgi:hypothetical protein
LRFRRSRALHSTVLPRGGSGSRLC